MVKSNRKTRCIQFFLGAAGITLVLLGLWQGEYTVTLNKAIRICLECIGIG